MIIKKTIFLTLSLILCCSLYSSDNGSGLGVLAGGGAGAAGSPKSPMQRVASPSAADEAAVAPSFKLLESASIPTAASAIPAAAPIDKRSKVKKIWDGLWSKKPAAAPTQPDTQITRYEAPKPTSPSAGAAAPKPQKPASALENIRAAAEATHATSQNVLVTAAGVASAVPQLQALATQVGGDVARTTASAHVLVDSAGEQGRGLLQEGRQLVAQADDAVARAAAQAIPIAAKVEKTAEHVNGAAKAVKTTTRHVFNWRTGVGVTGAATAFAGVILFYLGCKKAYVEDPTGKGPKTRAEDEERKKKNGHKLMAIGGAVSALGVATIVASAKLGR